VTTRDGHIASHHGITVHFLPSSPPPPLLRGMRNQEALTPVSQSSSHKHLPPIACCNMVWEDRHALVPACHGRAQHSWLLSGGLS